MISIKCVTHVVIAATVGCFTTETVAEELSLPSNARILDPDVILYSWPYPTVSPDGDWVAYISKGFICACNVQKPQPRQLFEVPHTWTHVLARPENAHAGSDFGALTRGLSREDRNAVMAQITHTVFGLQWTAEQDEVAFAMQSFDSDREMVISDFWKASLTGNVTKLAHVEDALSNHRIGNQFYLTRDRNFIVIPGFKRPLIWNLETNGPRATPFLHLTPSPTSGRWIGIEKDTRQLVLTDKTFEIVKRFNEFRPARSWGFKSDWSPDERFIIWRNQIGFDHFSNWEGFWMNLETGEKRELSGRFMNERFGFTGRGGEFWRCGATGAKMNWHDTVVGAHLTIAPEGQRKPQDVWRIEVDPERRTVSDHAMFPPLRPDSRCDLFVIGFPRPFGARAGYVWHLIDRKGNTWRFPGDDNEKFISPYEVVGFAEGDKTIVAHDEQQLFSIPVATIKLAEKIE